MNLHKPTTTALIIISCLAFLAGCPPRIIRYPVVRAARVNLGRPIELVVVSRVEAGRGRFRAGGQDWEALTERPVLDAVEAQVMAALSQSEYYGVIDERTQTVVRSQDIQNLDPATAGYREALYEADPARVAQLTATVWSYVEDRREVAPEQVVLETRRGEDRRVVGRENAQIPHYRRYPVGAMRVSFRMTSAADDSVIYEGSYASAWNEDDAEAVQSLGPEEGAGPAPDPRGVAVLLAGDIARRFVADVSPHPEPLDLEIVEQGDVASRNLLYHGAAALAERRLFERVRAGGYDSPAAEAAEHYHLGCALLLQGLIEDALREFTRAQEIDGQGTYRRAQDEAQTILAEQRQIRPPASE